MGTDAETRRLLKAMRGIARAMDVHSARIHRTVGLTLPQFIVLDCVRALGEVTSRTISREAGLSPPTVVGILDKLTTKGLVERHRSLTDRRVVHTKLTSAGHKTLDNAPPLFSEQFLKGLERLEPRDLERFVLVLEQAADLHEPKVAPPNRLAVADRTSAADR